MVCLRVAPWLLMVTSAAQLLAPADTGRAAPLIRKSVASLCSSTSPARVVVEAERVARGQRPVAGLAPHPALAREAFLQAHADVVLAVAQLGVAARPFVDFVAVMGVARWVAPQVGEVGPGFLEVVVVAVMAARFDFLLQMPGVDVFLIACGGFFRGIKGNGGASGQYAVRGNDVVAQHQGVPPDACSKK